MRLSGMKDTQDRIQHTLKTGKYFRHNLFDTTF